MDGAFIFEAESSSYWGNVTLPTLELLAGITVDQILVGLRAARNSTDPDKMRSMKCLGGPPNRFIQVNVEAFEAATGITLLTLRNAIAGAV